MRQDGCALVRLGRLAWALLVAALELPFDRALRATDCQNSPALPSRKAQWLQKTCLAVSRVLELEGVVSGEIPHRGLLVCNHLSYLDVIVLGALRPCIFVSKSEVIRWPLFGSLARAAGTIFVDRGRRTDVRRVGNEIRQRLGEDAIVVVFPEATSSPGHTVLPFKSALLEPVCSVDAPVTAAALDYQLPDGNAAMEVCYWGDHSLGRHLWHLLGRKPVRFSVAFSSVRSESPDRKLLARELHCEVSRLHETLRCRAFGTSLPSLAPRLTPECL